MTECVRPAPRDGGGAAPLADDAPQVRTVARRAVVPAPPSEVWRHLAEPELLARWLADPGHWEPGGIFRLDFGDGDFFSGRVREWEPPAVLGLEWKFMGVGPVYDIRFTLSPVEGGTAVAVRDHGARDEEEAQGLAEGWDDFLSRLAGAVRLDVRTRYEWSQTIAAAALLPGACPGLLDVLRGGEYWRECFPDEGLTVQAEEDGARLRFEHQGGRTEARVRVEPAGGGDRLVGVLHGGWTGLPAESRIPERRRFAGLWARTLYGLEHA